MLVVSRQLMHGTFDAQKSGAKLYIYIYLDGNKNFAVFSDNVWITEDAFAEIELKNPGAVLQVSGVNRRSYSNRRSIRNDK
jgi:hypothetical protein